MKLETEQYPRASFKETPNIQVRLLGWKPKRRGEIGSKRETGKEGTVSTGPGGEKENSRAGPGRHPGASGGSTLWPKEAAEDSAPKQESGGTWWSGILGKSNQGESARVTTRFVVPPLEPPPGGAARRIGSEGTSENPLLRSAALARGGVPRDSLGEELRKNIFHHSSSQQPFGSFPFPFFVSPSIFCSIPLLHSFVEHLAKTTAFLTKAVRFSSLLSSFVYCYRARNPSEQEPSATNMTVKIPTSRRTSSTELRDCRGRMVTMTVRC